MNFKKLKIEVSELVLFKILFVVLAIINIFTLTYFSAKIHALEENDIDKTVFTQYKCQVKVLSDELTKTKTELERLQLENERLESEFEVLESETNNFIDISEGLIHEYYTDIHEMVLFMANNSKKSRSVELETELETLDLSSSREVTNMTADEFNELIEDICDYRDQDYDTHPFYNTGKTLVEVEEKYEINGIYILTIFTIESGLGENMIRKNNAGGITKNGTYAEFETINDCILYLGQLLEKYSDKYGLETFPEIGSRYLENYVPWAKEADEISTLYMDMAYKNIES